jgi:DNA-binding transcriptional LysR family regulator
MALRNLRVLRYIDEVARIGSVRQAANRLNVTPSALLRRIQDVEYDLGAKIFERRASGVHLTAAGEFIIRWIRSQDADLRRVHSQIEELSGLRRGEIRIACSQAVARSFLIREILAFQVRHPLVKFQVVVADHRTAINLLADYQTDLVLVFRPSRSPELQTILTIGQRLVAVFASNHPLAGEKSLRLRQCALYDVALPEGSFGGREILENQLATSSSKLNIVFEANSFEMLGDFVASTQAITFQIEIGALGWMQDPRFAVRPISELDGAYGPLVLGQFKGRTLSVAVASFAEQVSRKMESMRTLPMAGKPSDQPLP